MLDNLFHGCFSPYMFITSGMQLTFGKDRRELQDMTAAQNQQFQLEIRAAKERFQDEQEAHKLADMRVKMALCRKFRSDEKFKQLKLQDMNKELVAFFEKSLPIAQKNIPALIDAAEQYKKLGYNRSCPLNVILLQTCRDDIKYAEIHDNLEKTEGELGNLVYRRWCNKDVAHNYALMNLHTLMGNIPTLVISPFFNNGKIHFTVSMWEAQSEMQPLIRPLFSINCNRIDLKESKELQKEIQKKITIISILLSGTARDTYMLMTQGLPPTLPNYIKDHSEVQTFLKDIKNKEIADFIIEEYRTTVHQLTDQKDPSGILDHQQMAILGKEAEKASTQLSLCLNCKTK